MEDTQKKVRIIRNFPATLERSWTAFTSVEDMLKWHAPVGMSNPHVEVDLRVGGQYAITMEYVDSHERVTVRGVYKEIKKPTVLVYSWKWDGSEEETEVRVQLRKITENETEVTLTHSGFSDQPTVEDIKRHRTHADHKGGWTTAFTKLDSLLVS
jgi:uncharacterized protein YndB with AHSA1/START domain